MWAKSYVEASEMKKETETGVSLHVRSKPAKTNPNSGTGSFHHFALHVSGICHLYAPAHHARCSFAGALISFALRRKMVANSSTKTCCNRKFIYLQL